MKLKTQELIRGIELGSYLGVSLLLNILGEGSNIEQVREIISFLENHQIDLNQIREILSNVYMLDYLSSFKTQTLTSDYKELKCMYDEIIYNTSKFYKEFGMEDPISIFATYVYMYRSGYFSYEKKFLYSNNMKDFAKLSGLDVVRGKGVCRSISSMLTDIYNEMDMSSYNLTVNTSSEDIKRLKKLNYVQLESESESKNFVKFVGIITKYFPLANHLITMVEKDGKNYIFDPTNDGLLRCYNSFLLQVNEKEEFFMKNYSFGLSNFMFNIFGQYSDGINVIAKSKQLSLPTVSDKEYEEMYLKTLKLCLENKDIFESFYQNNKYLIEQIYSLSENQSGLIKRLIPIIPNKKK